MEISKYIFSALILGLLNFPIIKAQKQVENLNRGIIAFQQADGILIQWRLLGNEPYNTSFNIYRNGEKINNTPIERVTSFVDKTGTINSKYTVSILIKDKESLKSEPARFFEKMESQQAGYFDIPIQRPVKGINGGTYFANDASVGDLNGDGEYEIVLKWMPNNARDNSHNGITDNVLIDAYSLNGSLLWRIDLGPNIRAGAHYTQFLVFDFDGDGKSEVMVKTAPGTKDGVGNFLSGGPASNTDNNAIYRNQSGFIIEGPEYITVFDGFTGKELATENYWPLRGRVADWGDRQGNRVDRFNATVAYLDGQRPSAVFQRGYYTRMTMAAWDWRDGELSRRWTFDTNTEGNESFYGQGNHAIHVIDANNDGKHDIVTGAAVINSKGKGLNNVSKTINKSGHGDACHVTYMRKNDKVPYIFMPFEGAGGIALRPANSENYLWHHHKGVDYGRGVGAEIDHESPGFHFWGAGAGGNNLYNFSGERVGNAPNSCNFIIWWDGQLSRELLNRNTIDKWSIKNNSPTRLLDGTGARSINGTKSTPVLQADLVGDWREEVILVRGDMEALRVFATTIPTTYKLYTFMHDPIYRVAVSWQNSSYNQPPHPGFYVATDMDFPPPKPDVFIPKTKGN